MRKIELPVPSFGHLSDLFAALDIAVRKKCTQKKYGKKAACTPWRMMHLATDAEGDVLAVEITDTEGSMCCCRKWAS